MYERLVGKRREKMINERPTEKGMINQSSEDRLRELLTLAEVYKQARDAGWRPEEKKRGKKKSSNIRALPFYGGLFDDD